MKCRDVRLFLDAYLAGDVAPETARYMEQHLAGCAACRTQAAQARHVLAGLRSLPAFAPTAGFAAQVMGQVLVERPAIAPAAQPLRYFALETSLGEALVAFNDEGVVQFSIGRNERTVVAEVQERYGEQPRHGSPPRHLVQALVRTVEARRAVAQPRVSLARLPAFQRLVLEKVQEIGYGVVRPYWWVAKEIGRPQATRAVATALARNPVPVLVPCHRVVMADGSLGGYIFGQEMKARLLEREGLTLAQVTHAVTVFYGCKSTGIFCFPTCPQAKRLHPENAVPFRSPQAAWAAGFRPCLICRPG